MTGSGPLRCLRAALAGQTLSLFLCFTEKLRDTLGSLHTCCPPAVRSLGCCPRHGLCCPVLLYAVSLLFCQFPFCPREPWEGIRRAPCRTEPLGALGRVGACQHTLGEAAGGGAEQVLRLCESQGPEVTLPCHLTPLSAPSLTMHPALSCLP